MKVNCTRYRSGMKIRSSAVHRVTRSRVSSRTPKLCLGLFLLTRPSAVKTFPTHSAQSACVVSHNSNKCQTYVVNFTPVFFVDGGAHHTLRTRQRTTRPRY